MGFTRVNLIQEGADGGADPKGARRYTKVYRVEYDDFNEGSGDAISHIPVLRWDVYSESGGYIDYGALAEDVTAAPEAPSESFAWLVTVRYSSQLWDDFQTNVNSGGSSPLGGPASKPSSGGGGENTPANPLMMPGKLTFGSIKGRRAMEREYVYSFGEWVEEGRWIANSAEQPFDPPAERDETWRTITFVRNELLLLSRMEGYDAFADTLNAATFLGRFPARTVKCESIDFESASENNVDFWIVTYNFIYRKQGWDLKPRDEGTVEIVLGARRCILDEHGIPITEPVPLNGTGGKLDPGDPAIYFDGVGTNPVPFVLYPDADFDALNIG